MLIAHVRALIGIKYRDAVAALQNREQFHPCIVYIFTVDQIYFFHIFPHSCYFSFLMSVFSAAASAAR